MRTTVTIKLQSAFLESDLHYCHSQLNHQSSLVDYIGAAPGNQFLYYWLT